MADTIAFEPVGLEIGGYGDFFAEITDINLEQSRDSIDVSNFSSEDFKDYIMSKLRDAGELTGTMNFDPSQSAPFENEPTSTTISFPNGTGGITGNTWTFDAFLMSYGMSGSVGSQMTSSFTLKLTGAIT